MTEMIYEYDGSFEGFLTCIFESYAQKEVLTAISCGEDIPFMLFPVRTVLTDRDHAARVYRKVVKLSPEAADLLRRGFLTCLPQRERSLFDLIYLAFHHALPQDPTDDRILLLTRAIGHLVREAEHYRGFVRFADYGGVLVGQIAPKNRGRPISASGCRRRLFSSTTKPTGRDCSTPGGSGRSAPWTGWTWTAPARRRPSARPSGGSSTPPLPSPSGTTPNCSRPTCPSGSGAT